MRGEKGAFQGFSSGCHSREGSAERVILIMQSSEYPDVKSLPNDDSLPPPKVVLREGRCQVVDVANPQGGCSPSLPVGDDVANGGLAQK